MARPSLPLGSHGKITVCQENKTFIARTKFRDLDGVVRLVKRTGKSKAAAERALKVALAERQAPIAGVTVAPESRISKVAELWFADLEKAVDAGRRSPGTLSTYRSIYDNHVAPSLGELRLREAKTPVIDHAISAVKERSPSRARTAKVVKLRRRRELIGDDVEPVFPDSLGGWRDPANVRRLTDRQTAEVLQDILGPVASAEEEAEEPVPHHRPVSETEDHYVERGSGGSWEGTADGGPVPRPTDGPDE